VTLSIGLDQTMPPNLEDLVLGEVLAERARTHGRSPFLELRDGELTYEEVDTTANRVAAGLASQGVDRGDHVAVMLPNSADFVHVIFALARLGAVAVPVNTAYKGDLLRHVLDTSDATALVVDGGYLDHVAAVARRLPDLRFMAVRAEERLPLDTLGIPLVPFSSLLQHGADPPRADVSFSDLQAIMYTSGTTGRSKGAMVPHSLALVCALDSLRFVSGGSRTIYCPLPLFHAAGLWDGMMSALLSGASIAIVERFSASRFWDDARRFDAETAMGVFSMIPILLNQPPAPDDIDNPLHTFYMGKSSLDAAFFDRFGAHTVETYTSTEAGIGTASPYGEWRVGSMGRSHDERFEVAVLDEHDRRVGPGQPGELALRPRQPHVITAGYYGRDDVTAACFRNLWFHTGDRAYVDDDGYFYFLDRMTDAIRRRGENISAFDLECEVNLHPAILECAAIGVPSELEEEDVKVVVVRRPGVDLAEEELAAYCMERLPSFMVPRYIEFTPVLPRTPTGKVAKHHLRGEGDHGLTSATWDGGARGRGNTAPSTAVGQRGRR
jgi:crotonobetaine/carnitine-CoA ligase